MANVEIKKVLNKVYLRQKPLTEDFKQFCNQLGFLEQNLRQCIKQSKPDELEEHCKQYIINFLKETFYKGKNLINTKDRIDCAIYAAVNRSSPVLVLIETKRHNSPEFPTCNNLNTKAMQETVLYFLRERVKEKNLDIKHIVITDGFQWFVFDSSDFEKYFYENKKLLNNYENFDISQNLANSKTRVFYEQIASPVIETVKNKIPFVYFDIRNLDNNQKVDVYKLLSPQHLLRQFSCNDSNELNAPFYNELLYILGLEEVADGKKRTICRLKPSIRNNASIVENAINQIEDSISNEDSQYEMALSLTITWINRILFLKLLETQLVNYHKGDKDYCFLNTTRISGFDDLHQLFFKVLAVPTTNRKPEINEKYGPIPYLNSSLFEMSEFEDRFKISGLRDDEIPVYAHTVLYDNRNSKRLSGNLKILDYLFKFLDSYDFGSVPEDNSLTCDNRKTLINASVLGLIFEKINGYKDGSFFTPGTITQYMCKEAIRRAVVQKFNEEKKWNCQTFDDLCNQKLERADANKIINSIHICDPAVGSGHFLVSALNELIAIKSELGILCLADNPNRILKKAISIDNDELMVYDDDGDIFVYNPVNEHDTANHAVQKTLFEEKRTIIENCLFGVDINPNSVNICRLRLWIELLKNAYYKSDGTLETLPNIDINIKCGNSLVSRYPIEIGKAVSNGTNLSKEIKEYKEQVKNYKKENNKTEKKKVEETIRKIKEKIVPSVQLNLELEDSDTAKNREAVENNIYSNSMEWMIEFPEVLDDEGRYQGFDVVIGNPPYGVSIKDEYRGVLLKHIGKVPDYEIYYYFVEHSRKILKNNGVLSFIIPNTWLFNVNAKKWRESLFCKWKMSIVLDCTNFKIFLSADIRNTIVRFQKSETGTMSLSYIPTEHVTTWESLIAKKECDMLKKDVLTMNQNWGLAFKLNNTMLKLINKISSQSFHIDENSGYESTQGYIPYRLSDLKKVYGEIRGEEIKTKREWHSMKKSEKYWIQEIYGKDISKYTYKTTGEYVFYGKHVGTYVDEKFFKGRRLLIREITDPTIIACIIDEELLHDPQLIPIIATEKSKYDLNIIWAILNSKLATFYHFNHSPKATKGSFPKILIEDIKTFPLPEIDSKNQQQINKLVEQILDKKNPPADITALEREIDLLVYHLYGLTYDEVLIVDPETAITKELYDA